MSLADPIAPQTKRLTCCRWPLNRGRLWVYFLLVLVALGAIWLIDRRAVKTHGVQEDPTRSLPAGR